MRPFTVDNATRHRYPLVVNLPHSGIALPSAMAKQLAPKVVLASSDWLLPVLYDFLPEMGVTVLVNHMSRYVVDPNRAPTAREVPGHIAQGVVYQKNTWGRPLYRQPLGEAAITERLDAFYRPYHQQLQQLIEAKVAAFGHCLVLDLHSFANYVKSDGRKVRQVVLGNQHDRCSDKALRLWLAGQLEAVGLSVANNYPFAGGYITQHYGKLPQVQSMQLELRYRAYLGQRVFGEEVITEADSVQFNRAKQQLQTVMTALLARLDEG